MTRLTENKTAKIEIFFGNEQSSDGKESSSDSDNLGFLHPDIYSDEPFSFE